MSTLGIGLIRRSARGSACLSKRLLPAWLAAFSLGCALLVQRSSQRSDPEHNRAEPSLVTAPTADFSYRGRALSSEGAPAEGARAQLLTSDGKPLESVTADAEGEFEFRARPEQFRIRVEHPLWGSVGTEVLKAVALARQGVEPLVLVLDACRLSGMVIDRLGQPIAEAQVQLTSLNEPETARASKGPSLVVRRSWTLTRAGGEFSTDPQPPGRYQVTAWARGFALRTVLLELAGASPFLRFELTEYRSILGRVLDPDGRPLAEATVHACEGASEVELISAANGSFELDASAINCLVVARHPRFAHSPLERAAGGQRLELKLRRGGSIEGVATDISGHTTHDLNIKISSYSPAEGEVEFEQDRFGGSRAFVREFRLGSLAPGTYTLTVFRRWGPSPEEQSDYAESGEIRVLPGGVTRGVQLVVKTDSSQRISEDAPSSEDEQSGSYGS